MVATRGKTRRRLSRNRSYSRRVRKSPCRRKGPAVCRRMPGCKYASGRKRSFCRKSGNTKRKTAGRRRRMRGGDGFGLFRRA